jgi:hydrogenase maturation protease
LIKKLSNDVKGSPEILVYGYGNPGRQDDALGVLLAEKIEQWAHDNCLHNIHVECNYQLNIEDAHKVSLFDIVIFADASKENIDGFSYTIIEPSAKTNFTMHAVSPSFILYLCNQIYGNKPSSYLLHIKGFDWQFMQEITAEAKTNLDNAITFLKTKLIEYNNNIYRQSKAISPVKHI